MKRVGLCGSSLVFLLIATGLLWAQEEPYQAQVLDEILVESERVVEQQNRLTIRPEGLPAQVNIITRDEVQRTPYTGDVLDIMRKVPGINIQKYPRGDMGHQIGLRGFIGNNGVAIFIDGMPMNTMHWYHGQMEIGWLVPEMIERIEVIKGPFSALYGDFALGGVINIKTKKADPSHNVGFYGGSYGTARGVGVFSNPNWQVVPFVLWEGYTRDGYRLNNQYDRGQFFNKITLPFAGGDVSVRFHYAARTWGDPGYLRIDQMQRGIISRKSAANSTDGGNGENANLVINYTPQGGEEGFHAALFYTYLWNQTARTFFPSPQRRRDGRENYCGWKLFYDYRPWEQLSLVVGNDLRYDSGRTNEFNTIKYYNITVPRYLYDFDYFGTGFFAQAQYKPFSFLKLIGGLRYDIFHINVDNKLYQQNSGNCSPDIWSPKIGLVITPYEDIHIYANKGTGFMSPAISQLSPFSAVQRPNFDLGVAKLDSWDVGINVLLWKLFQINLDYYNTLYQREQVFNPATQTTENMGASKRTGVELDLKIFITKELTIYGSLALLRARLKNPVTPGAYYIIGQPDNLSTLGVDFQKAWDGGKQEVVFDVCWTRSGRKTANETGTLIGPQFDRYLSRLSYRYKNWTAVFNAILTPRKYAGDYYYSMAGNIAITPYPTWDILAGLKYQF